MPTIEDMMCCGVREIADLRDSSTAKQAMLDLLGGDNYYDYGLFGGRTEPPKLTHFIFTEVSREEGKTQTYGKNFAKLITDNNLGAIVRTRRTNENPNHKKHFIHVYVWTPNVKNLWKWWQKNKPEGYGEGNKEESSSLDYFFW